MIANGTVPAFYGRWNRVQPGTTMKNQHGFTLIELMIVIVILGILAAISMVNFFSMKENSERASCLTNQRRILEGTILYVAERNVKDEVINVTALHPDDYISNLPSECPTSGDGSHDDYTITIANQIITDLGCDNEPAVHFWDGYK